MKRSEVYRMAAEIFLDGPGHEAAITLLEAHGAYQEFMWLRGEEWTNSRGHGCMALLLISEIARDKEAAEALLNKIEIGKLLDAGSGQRIARTAHGK